MNIHIKIKDNEVTEYEEILGSIRDTQLIRILKLDCYVDFLLTRKQIEYPFGYYRTFINSLPEVSEDFAILTKEDL